MPISIDLSSHSTAQIYTLKARKTRFKVLEIHNVRYHFKYKFRRAYKGYIAATASDIPVIYSLTLFHFQLL